MPSCCVVVDCVNKYSHSESISFHKFPHRKDFLIKWIEFTGRSNDWIPSRWSSICSSHFAPSDFRKHNRRNYLRAGAIPSLFRGTKGNQTNTNASNIFIKSDKSLNKDLKELSNDEEDINKRVEDNEKNVYEIQNQLKNFNVATSAIKEKISNTNREQKVFVQTVQNLSHIPSTTKDSSNSIFRIPKTSISEKQDGLQESVTTDLNILCKLCGLDSLRNIQTSISNIEMFNMIQKCFPSLQIEWNENYVQEICRQCYNNLRKFSNFIDIVKKKNSVTEISTRIETLKKQSKISSPHINIKQEPSANPPTIIKQEIISDAACSASCSNINVNNNEEIGKSRQIDEHMDKKFSHILHLPIINAEQAVNNCDVMEIISLDDALIELIDDDNQIENQNGNHHQQNNEINRISEAKVERPDEFSNDFAFPFNLSVHNICEEHNYTMLHNELEDRKENVDKEILSFNQEGKVRKISLPVQTELQIPKKSEIVVINEDILKPAPSKFKLYTCHDCNLPFFFEVHLNEHRKIHHQNAFSHFCINCNAKFKSFIDLLRHRKKCGSKLKLPKKITTNLSTCMKCGKVFVSKLSLNNHQKYICEFPQKERIFNCKYCKMKLNKWMKLRQHEKKCRQSKKPTGQNELRPAETHDSRPKIIENIQTVNPSNDKRMLDPAIFLPPHVHQNSKLHTCTICFRSYKLAQNLIRHSIKRHRFFTGNFNSIDMRSNNIKDQMSLTNSQHLLNNTIFLKNDHHICIECGKKYKYLQGLQEHIAKYHVDIKPEFPCQMCDKVFNGLRNLKQHMQQHSNIRRKCPMCDKTFKHFSGLNQHKRAFHLKLKPHECIVCNRKFSLKADMKRCRHVDQRLRHLRKDYLTKGNFDLD